MSYDKRPLVIYHANCWDGFCAAWISRKYFKDIEAVPAHYGQPPPDVAGRRVFVLDFSYPRDVLLKMKAAAKSLLVLDHHATAKEALAGLDFCKFEDDKSGGRMAWDFFFPNTPRPWLVDYTEDRDLWRHALPHSEEVNAALRSYPLDFDLWSAFAVQDVKDFIQDGRAIRRREKQIVADHVRNAVLTNVGGHNVLAVNATVLFSEIAGELAKCRTFGACYFMRPDGRRQWSLRSDEGGIDVSAIAKAHGGGGHKHAAGYED